jgi:phosphoribosyl 1,2-cyclic phosphodiesterase
VSISICFLGTGGARFVVSKQIRASGGMWMRFGSTQIHVDPGPGALVRALSTIPPQRPAELDAIVLSHKHLDHAGDVNAIIEAMAQGGWRPRGALFAPRDVWEGDSILLPYARRFVPRHEIVEECGGPYAINEVEVRASIRHVHPVETYGLHFRYEGTTVSYLPCTRFFDELIADYRSHAPDVLVINVLRFADSLDVDHLTFDDAKRLIAGIRPGAAILTHFGTKMLERDPRRLAYELEDDLGIRVYAAHDGWTYDAPIRRIDVA